MKMRKPNCNSFFMAGEKTSFSLSDSLNMPRVLYMTNVSAVSPVRASALTAPTTLKPSRTSIVAKISLPLAEIIPDVEVVTN